MLFGVVYNCINCGGRLRTTPRRSLMRRVLFLLSKNIDIDSKFSLEEKKEKPQTKIPAIPILLFTFYSLLASELVGIGIVGIGTNSSFNCIPNP